MAESGKGQIRLQLGTEQITFVDVPEEVIKSIAPLPYTHSAYFDLAAPHSIVPIAALSATRTRWDAAIRAHGLMASASQGLIPKRRPILAQRTAQAECYAVADGNSTFIVAVLSGWKDIPVEF